MIRIGASFSRSRTAEGQDGLRKRIADENLPSCAASYRISVIVRLSKVACPAITQAGGVPPFANLAMPRCRDEPLEFGTRI